MKKSIHIESAKPEMLLGKAVTDEQGRTLCAEGTILTEKLINRFTQMGIITITIQTDEIMSKEEYDQEKNIIEKRFKNPAKGSLLQKIKNIVLEQLEAKKG